VNNLFRGFGAVFYKEVLHVRRDSATLFFSLFIPLIQMFVLGFGIDTNVRQIHTVVFNGDGRRESRELIDRLKNSDTFNIIDYVANDRDLAEHVAFAEGAQSDFHVVTIVLNEQDDMSSIHCSTCECWRISESWNRSPIGLASRN